MPLSCASHPSILSSYQYPPFLLNRQFSSLYKISSVSIQNGSAISYLQSPNPKQPNTQTPLPALTLHLPLATAPFLSFPSRQTMHWPEAWSPLSHQPFSTRLTSRGLHTVGAHTVDLYVPKSDSHLSMVVLRVLSAAFLPSRPLPTS